MRRIVRPHIATKYGPCIDCNMGTRSHVLSPAEYESYETEVVIARSDDFASKDWEEVDTITKYALSQEAVVICHKCWIKKKDSFERVIDANFNTWKNGGMTAVRPVMRVLKNLRYLQIESELNEVARSQIIELRAMSKSLLTSKPGAEEE